MLDRMSVGELPAKHHITLRGPGGELRYEECLTRQGFDGPYTILYHLDRPQTASAGVLTDLGWPAAVSGEASPRPLAKRHYKTQDLPAGSGTPLSARRPLMFNADVVVGLVQPTEADAVWFANGDADELFFAFQGGGTLETPLGDIRFERLDYVFVPKGLPYRLLPDAGANWLWIECPGGMGLLRQWRNEVGQLRMDAPYSHRDFKRPVFSGPRDTALRTLVVKREQFTAFELPHSPLDVVGWDGTVYPWAFPILNFQPRAGLVHLPPTWHGTFQTRGALICSFVPRVVDFHPEAIPCPYPHSSVDCDEILFYCDGNFTSRRGVGPGSISHHPMGVPHGPHPGAYERSIGTSRTDELAVMLDTFKPLQPTAFAMGVEDAAYHESFR